MFPKRSASIHPTYIISTLMLLFITTSCTHTTPVPTSQVNVDNDFTQYTSQLFATEIASNTLNLHYTLSNPDSYNIVEATPSLGDFSVNITKQHMAIENALATLSHFPYEQLSFSNQLTYDILLDSFITTQEGLDYTYFYEPLTPYTGIHAQLPILLSEFPLNTEEDIHTYLTLLKTFPEYFTSLIDFERQKTALGLFMSDSELDHVLEDCTAFVAMKENYLVTSFSERISHITFIDKDKAQAFKKENNDIVNDFVIPSYSSLITSLEDFRHSNTNLLGLCYYKNGRNYYSYLVQNNTGSSRTLPNIQFLIKNQLLEDMQDLQTALNTQQVSHTTTAPDLHMTPEEMLTSLEKDISHAFPTKNLVTATIKNVPTSMEPYLSPAFYLIPPLDQYTDNVIYLNQSHMTDDVSMYTTLAHEGFPGHLYQTTYYASTSPNPVRSLFSFGGYLEGWATYAEMCSYYLGVIPDSTATILQKNASLNLGLYAYVDIGIHYEGWSVADVVQFYKTYGITDTVIIERIYDLIKSTPSNYLKYYLGYLEFLELKKDCIQKWGPDFSQKRFHQAVLEIGPAPFSIVRKYLQLDALN